MLLCFRSEPLPRPELVVTIGARRTAGEQGFTLWTGGKENGNRKGTGRGRERDKVGQTGPAVGLPAVILSAVKDP